RARGREPSLCAARVGDGARHPLARAPVKRAGQDPPPPSSLSSSLQTSGALPASSGAAAFTEAGLPAEPPLLIFTSEPTMVTPPESMRTKPPGALRLICEAEIARLPLTVTPMSPLTPMVQLEPID